MGLDAVDWDDGVGCNSVGIVDDGDIPINRVKDGINRMTRAMALKLSLRGITVNTINPGWSEIERTKEELGDDYEYTKEIHPVGRLGEPADVADVVAFLTSDNASFVTGKSLLVDSSRTGVMQDELYRQYQKQVE